MMNTTQTNETVGAPENAHGTIAREFIQCACDDGTIGDFLVTNAGRQVSPKFNDLASLYAWAKENGWEREGGAYVYRGKH